jgi:hypothetical protein
MNPSDSGTQISASECFALLARVGVGRLVFTRHALPDVLPVRFQVDASAAADDPLPPLIVPAPPGSPHVGGIDGNVIALHADEVDPATGAGPSVVVHGRARLTRDGTAIRLIPELVRGRVLAAEPVTEPVAG